MTVQKKFSAVQKADYAFRSQYATHKIWIALHNGDTKTFFAKDCNATVLQMHCGHIRQVLQSPGLGLQDCLAKEKYFRRRYRAAEVYRRLPDGSWSQDPVIKFISGNRVEESTDPLPPDLTWQVVLKDSGLFAFELRPLATIQPPVPIPTTPAFTKPPASKRTAPDATSAGAIARRAYGFPQ